MPGLPPASAPGRQEHARSTASPSKVYANSAARRGDYRMHRAGRPVERCIADESDKPHTPAVIITALPRAAATLLSPPRDPGPAGRRRARRRIPWAMREPERVPSMIIPRAGRRTDDPLNDRRNRGTRGSAGRRPGPDAVRHMSVHSWTQPDSHGLSGTSPGQKEQPARPGKPSSRAVYAGGGRCWVRTNVG